MEKLPSRTRTFTWNNNEIAYISVSESAIRRGGTTQGGKTEAFPPCAVPRTGFEPVLPP